MNYISLFSGIEAASVAWGPLGWNPIAFSEIDPFCCELLAERFPDVPNLGDISGVDWTEYEGSVDVIIGGSPCQAFSMAGRRLGLMDERGQLMLEFVRCVREVKPRWVIWENVPGVLSQDEGRAFGTLLGELEDCGYALSWRVLDAQFFGVPQRRRRVFLIGHPVPGCAAGVLFEPDSLRGDNPPSREKRAQLAADAERRAGGSYTLKHDPCHPLCAQGHTPTVCIGFSAGQSAAAGSIAAQDEVASTLRASESGTNQVPSVAYAIAANTIDRAPKNGGNGTGYSEELCYTLTTADRHAVAFPWNTDAMLTANDEVSPTLRAAHSGGPVVCMASDQANAEIMEECSPCQTARQHKGTAIVASGYVVRRLMPVECERLQGFPDGWTDLGGTADAPRYKACGNSMAVPVINYIGRRIEAVDSIF